MVDLCEASAGPFDWVTFDEPNGILGLDLIAVPEPSSLVPPAWAWRRWSVTAGDAEETPRETSRLSVAD